MIKTFTFVDYKKPKWNLSEKTFVYEFAFHKDPIEATQILH